MAQREIVRGDRYARGYGTEWVKMRAEILPMLAEANGGLCALCGYPVDFGSKAPQPTSPSLDHVVPKAEGGSDHPSNLQLAHFGCNARKRGRLMPGSPMSRTVPFPQHMRAMVTLVCGPPGSGKSTYVEERRKPGDLVLDVDALFAALTGMPWYQGSKDALPFVLAARDAVLAQLEAPARVRRAWVITTGGQGERARLQRRLGADVVMLAVPPDECLRRIAADPRRKGSTTDWRRLVHQWWSEYSRTEAVGA